MKHNGIECVYIYNQKENQRTCKNVTKEELKINVKSESFIMDKMECQKKSLSHR